MPKINVLRTIAVLEIDTATVTQEAKELLASYLLIYVDTDTEMQEDLYNVEEWQVNLQAANIPLDAPGTEILAALEQVCRDHNATYIRIVNL